MTAYIKSPHADGLLTVGGLSMSILFLLFGFCRRRGKEAAPRTPPVRVGVPMGTVVKRKRGGALVGELINPGQTLLVARGGKGGLGVVRPAAQQTSKGRGKFLDEVRIGFSVQQV